MKKFIILFIIIIIEAITILPSKSYDNNYNYVNPIRIVFITDDNYVLPVKTAIRSVKTNKKSQTKIEINIVGVDLSIKNIEKIKKESEKNFKINIISFKPDNEKFPDKPTISGLVSDADYAKFSLSTIFPQYDKILYLDGDVIILKDLTELYNTELYDNYAAMVYDQQTKWYDNRDTEYFNNGVMLLNLKKMREDNIEKKLIKHKKNDKINRFKTQDSFNEVMSGKIISLPLIYDIFAPEYNKLLLTDKYNESSYFIEAHKKFLDEIAIIHYCGYDYIKPWKKTDLNDEAQKIWKKYAPSESEITEGEKIPDFKKEKTNEEQYFKTPVTNT